MCKDINLFNDDCVVSYHPILGKMLIYMKRDENLGKVYLVDKKLVTPNMPKLQYFSRIQTDYLNLKVEILPELNKDLLKYKNKSRAYVFRKDDGTNILFYRVDGKTIPKTRLNGIATKKILRALKDPRFPEKEINELVKDDYIPIIELWGSDLVNKYNILNGGTNVKLLEDIEGRSGYNVSIINILNANYDECEYTPMHPKRWMKIAVNYGLEHSKMFTVTDINVKSLFKVLDEIDSTNKKYNDNVVEGAVIHVYDDRLGYKMFKMKPLNILRKDVVVNAYSVHPDKIEYEINKILSSFDPLEISKHFDEYYNMLLDELRSDIMGKREDFSKKQRKMLMKLFMHRVIEELVKNYGCNDIKWLISKGADKRLIGLYKNICNCINKSGKRVRNCV